MIYHLYDQTQSTFIGLLMFIPQWTLVILAGFTLYYDIFLCMLIQTWVFVTFNKVMTAQYFLWYLALIPLVFINSELRHKRYYLLVLMAIIWIGGQVMWSGYSFKFEFLGEHVFSEI
jgi:phosphatidylinositol glycan class M